MTLYYLDPSAWVKRYLTEAGSSWVRNLFDRGEPFACCVLGYAEVSAALARQSGVRQIPSARKEMLRRDLWADWNEMLQVPLNLDIIQGAANLAWGHKLRGADAIHLAAVQWLHHSLLRRFASLVLVTADAELLQAAQELAFTVTNPAEVT
jgi:uncharacterized protein